MQGRNIKNEKKTKNDHANLAFNNSIICMSEITANHCYATQLYTTLFSKHFWFG